VLSVLPDIAGIIFVCQTWH